MFEQLRARAEQVVRAPSNQDLRRDLPVQPLLALARACFHVVAAAVEQRGIVDACFGSFMISARRLAHAQHDLHQVTGMTRDCRERARHVRWRIRHRQQAFGSAANVGQRRLQVITGHRQQALVEASGKYCPRTFLFGTRQRCTQCRFLGAQHLGAQASLAGKRDQQADRDHGGNGATQGTAQQDTTARQFRFVLGGTFAQQGEVTRFALVLITRPHDRDATVVARIAQACGLLLDLVHQCQCRDRIAAFGKHTGEQAFRAQAALRILPVAANHGSTRLTLGVQERVLVRIAFQTLGAQQPGLGARAQGSVAAEGMFKFARDRLALLDVGKRRIKAATACLGNAAIGKRQPKSDTITFALMCRDRLVEQGDRLFGGAAGQRQIGKIVQNRAEALVDAVRAFGVERALVVLPCALGVAKIIERVAEVDQDG